MRYRVIRVLYSLHYLDLHSEWMLPFGAVGVAAFLSFLGLAIDCHFDVRTGAEPVLLVFFKFSCQH